MIDQIDQGRIRELREKLQKHLDFQQGRSDSWDDAHLSIRDVADLLSILREKAEQIRAGEGRGGGPTERCAGCGRQAADDPTFPDEYCRRCWKEYKASPGLSEEDNPFGLEPMSADEERQLEDDERQRRAEHERDRREDR